MYPENRLEFFQPLTGQPISLPADPATPSLLLLDPTPNRAQTATRLSFAGWQVLAVDTNSLVTTCLAAETFAKLSDRPHSGWFRPQAVILEADHPLSPPEPKPAPSFAAFWLVNWLKFLGLQPRLSRSQSSSVVPFVLYTADQIALRDARYERELAITSRRPFLNPYSAIIERSSDDLLVQHLAVATGILLCRGCLARLEERERAYLAARHIYCETCSLASPIAPARFPSRLLALAAASNLPPTDSADPADPTDLDHPDPWVSSVM